MIVINDKLVPLSALLGAPQSLQALEEALEHTRRELLELLASEPVGPWLM